MIVGTGVDIVEPGRVEEVVRRRGRRFLERVFTPAERAYCERHRNKWERYAARFAAKEAAFKALGTGWRGGVRWRDVEVTNQRSGRPTLTLSGQAGKLAQAAGVRHISLSLTHTPKFVLAQVIFED
ncbi:MAG: holo-ACP synthase [Terriglobia bacterium]